MTHAQIGGRHGAAEIARYLSESAGPKQIVTSTRQDVFSVYNTLTGECNFVGSADEVQEYIERGQND